jgi:hypothetical protein
MAVREWILVVAFGACATWAAFDLAGGSHDQGNWFVLVACGICALASLYSAIDFTRHREENLSSTNVLLLAHSRRRHLSNG